MNEYRRERAVFNSIGCTYVIVLAVICLLPFWLIVSGSLTSENAIYTKGFGLVPAELSTEAYAIVFKSPQTVISAYGVSILVTTVGTLVGLTISSMAAYALSRRDLQTRNAFAFSFYFTMLFNGGLIPAYLLVVRYLGLKNSLLALILPPLITAWHVLILRNFMKTIPESITESAKIDGANDFFIYYTLILPLAKPGLAVIGLFTALHYWNDWHHAMLYIDDPRLMPLQYYLYKLLSRADFLKTATRGARVPTQDLPTESLKMAMAVVATGPILLLYPFVQRYFVKGLTIGAIKG